MSKKSTINLICFPFAGGTNTAFLPLIPHLQKDFRVTVVAYSGRDKRIQEPLLSDLELIVEDAWQQIQSQLSAPYVLYGHSMGAILAFLIAHRIQREKLPPPSYLVLSGKECPSTPCEIQEHLLPKATFREVLKKYGGIPDEILNNEAFLSFFEPIIRADMQAVETWKYRPTSTLSVPITIMNGIEDDLRETEVQGWQKEFSKPIEYKTFPGGHFFINDHAKEVADYLLKTIKVENN